MRAIRAAVVGYGLSGRVFHAPFIDSSDHFTLAAIVQRNGETAGCDYPDTAIVRSFEEVLEDRKIDLVVIATPNELHYPMAKEALEAGKHLVVDKPFTATAAEAEELIALAEQQDVHLFVFHNRRWDGDFMTLQKIIEGDGLGRMVSYEAHFDRYRPGLSKKAWKETDRFGTSIVHDLGTHLIDQVVCLFGKPEAVSGHLRKERDKSQIIDGFDIVLQYSGFNATLKASCLVKEPGPRYIVHGQDGSFVKYGIDPQEDDMIAGGHPLDQGWGMEEPEDWGVLNARINGLDFRGEIETLPGNYMGFYDNVAAVINGAAEIAMSPAEAMGTVAIIEAAFASHEQKRTIEL